jgi:hypothetical protein
MAETRTMVCPYCSYTCQSGGIGAVYCGPHHASFGTNTYPAVRMVEKAVAPDHPENPQ